MRDRQRPSNVSFPSLKGFSSNFSNTIGIPFGRSITSYFRAREEDPVLESIDDGFTKFSVVVRYV